MIEHWKLTLSLSLSLSLSSLLFPSLAFSGLMCPTKTNEDVVHILGKVEVFFIQDFVILGLIIGSALVSIPLNRSSDMYK